MVFDDNSGAFPCRQANRESVEIEDADCELVRKHPPRTSIGGLNNHLYFLLCGILLLALAGITLVPGPLSCPVPASSSIATLSLNSRPPKAIGSPCGSTRESALAAGCHFDVMSFTWLPDGCYDAELESEFLSLQPWNWYHDMEGKEEAEKEKVHKGELEVLFVKWGYHRVHCAYMWRKLQRAMEHGWPIDSYIGAMNHTRHCLKQLDKKNIDPETINTRIGVKWPTCND